MAVVHLVQHAEQRPGVNDPGRRERGTRQATRAGRWLADAGIAALFTSPRQHAVDAAALISATCGLAVHRDERLRDRLEWDGVEPAADFAAEWDRTTADRDYEPARGESSRRAGERLRDFLLAERYVGEKPVAAVTHSGVTVDLLRTLMGDDAVPDRLIRDGMPRGAITTVDGLRVVRIAHLP